MWYQIFLSNSNNLKPVQDYFMPKGFIIVYFVMFIFTFFRKIYVFPDDYMITSIPIKYCYTINFPTDLFYT